jgi:hypothetical protein
VATPAPEPPFHRWGRLADPPESRGAYLLIEEESTEGWKTPPPADAIRIWHRRPGAADDDDLNNWTVWLHRRELPAWMAAYVVEEWLPEGAEPSWEGT